MCCDDVLLHQQSYGCVTPALPHFDPPQRTPAWMWKHNVKYLLAYSEMKYLQCESQQQSESNVSVLWEFDCAYILAWKQIFYLELEKGKCLCHYMFQQLIEQSRGLFSLLINLSIIVVVNLYKRNTHLGFSQPKVMFPNCLFCQANSVTLTGSWFYNNIKRRKTVNCHFQESGTSSCLSFLFTVAVL